MTVNLFPKEGSLTDGGSSDDIAEDEPTGYKLSVEVAKQREQIVRLQNAVEDQSRLLQEICHQLKQTARPLDTAKSLDREDTDDTAF